MAAGHRAVAAARLIVACATFGCNRHRDYGPHLGGFTLGTPLSADQARISCHATPTSASDSVWQSDNPDLANSLRWCTAADTVALLFARD